LIFDATWLNDRDQFLFPNNGWKADKEFQNDCLTYTLFHGQNKISSKQGTNNWIPFTEKEVNSRDKFDSNFMTDFMSGKLGNSPLEGWTAKQDGVFNEVLNNKNTSPSKLGTPLVVPSTLTSCVQEENFNSQNQANNRQINLSPATAKTNLDKNPQSSTNFDPLEGEISDIETELFTDQTDNFIPNSPLEFSPQAKAVFEAGLELWKYYHKTQDLPLLRTCWQRNLSGVERLGQNEVLGVSNSNVNAAFYDIKEHFQGRNEIGRMNNRSVDEKYNFLISNLRDSLKILEAKIQPKVYEFGFLLG